MREGGRKRERERGREGEGGRERERVRDVWGGWEVNQSLV